MGLIRGGLVAIVGVVLFISLLLGNIFLTLSWSLEYGNVKTELVSVVNELIKDNGGIETIIGGNFGLMQAYCQNNSEYVFSQGEYTFMIPCSVALQDEPAVVNYAIGTIVEKYYYKEYNCSFWDCLKQSAESGAPFFLVSEQAKSYWDSNFYLCLFASVALIILFFFLIEKKTNFPFIAGGLIIVSSLPFLKLEWIGSLFGDAFYGMLSLPFSQAYAVFWRILIIGIAFLIVGIILKFFKIGFKISGFFSRFSKQESVSKEEVKEIVKKEVKKSKEEERGKKKK